jgi:hypothetical protein
LVSFQISGRQATHRNWCRSQVIKCRSACFKETVLSSIGANEDDEDAYLTNDEESRERKQFVVCVSHNRLTPSTSTLRRGCTKGAAMITFAVNVALGWSGEIQ